MDHITIVYIVFQETDNQPVVVHESILTHMQRINGACLGPAFMVQENDKKEGEDVTKC